MIIHSKLFLNHRFLYVVADKEKCRIIVAIVLCQQLSSLIFLTQSQQIFTGAFLPVILRGVITKRYTPGIGKLLMVMVLLGVTFGEGPKNTTSVALNLDQSNGYVTWEMLRLLTD